jgi:flagellar hook-basal body complex protein FliE
MTGLEVAPITGMESAVRPATEVTGPAGFGDWYTRALADANSAIQQSDAELKAFATGQSTNVHRVMMAAENASLSFQLVVQVRNKALEAYQEMMRMQL